MRSRRTRLLVVLGAVALILVVGVFWLRSADYQIRSWHVATRLAMGNDLSWWERVYGAARGDTPQYWWDRARQHESALLRMGYLTNCEFRLTNQVITREFSSNYFRLIYRRIGTNDNQVWRSQALTNGTGFAQMFLAKDYAIWDQTFRECAALYASNRPPAAVSANGGE